MEVKINRVQSPTSNVQCQQKLRIVFLITIILLVIPINLHSFTWDKVSYGIGYSGGVCYTGFALSKENLAPYSFDFTAKLYWVNEVKGSISYTLRNEDEISIGVGYGWWPKLVDREGLSLYIPNEDPTTGEAWVITSSEWQISYYSLSIQFKNGELYYGLSGYYCLAITDEELDAMNSEFWPSDTTLSVERKCRGGSIYCLWEGSSMFGVSNLKPFLKLQLGWAKEYQNSAPWEWDEKLTVGLTGIYLGMRFEVGGGN